MDFSRYCGHPPPPPPPTPPPPLSRPFISYWFQPRNKSDFNSVKLDSLAVLSYHVAYYMLYKISAQCIARDLHTIATWPLIEDSSRCSEEIGTIHELRLSVLSLLLLFCISVMYSHGRHRPLRWVTADGKMKKCFTCEWYSCGFFFSHICILLSSYLSISVFCSTKSSFCVFSFSAFSSFNPFSTLFSVSVVSSSNPFNTLVFCQRRFFSQPIQWCVFRTPYSVTSSVTLWYSVNNLLYLRGEMHLWREK